MNAFIVVLTLSFASLIPVLIILLVAGVFDALLFKYVQLIYDWRGYFRNSKFRKHNKDALGISKIVEGLNVGSAYDARNIDALINNQITSIVNVCHVDTYHGEDIDGCMYIQLPLNDNYFNDYKTFKMAVDYTRANHNLGFNVLVHCVNGMNRSIGVAVAFLAVKLNISFEEAYGMIKEVRPFVKILSEPESMAKRYIAEKQLSKS